MEYNFGTDLLNDVEGRLGIKGEVLEPIWSKDDYYMRIKFGEKVWHLSQHWLQKYLALQISGAQVAQEIVIPYIQGTFEPDIFLFFGLG